MMYLWVAILIMLTINILFVLFTTRDSISKAYHKGFTDGMTKVIEQDYVRLDAVIKND